LLARGWFYWFAKPSFPRLIINDALFGNKGMLACLGFLFWVLSVNLPLFFGVFCR